MDILNWILNKVNDKDETKQPQKSSYTNKKPNMDSKYNDTIIVEINTLINKIQSCNNRQILLNIEQYMSNGGDINLEANDKTTIFYVIYKKYDIVLITELLQYDDIDVNLYKYSWWNHNIADMFYNVVPFIERHKKMDVNNYRTNDYIYKEALVDALTYFKLVRDFILLKCDDKMYNIMLLIDNYINNHILYDEVFNALHNNIVFDYAPEHLCFNETKKRKMTTTTIKPQKMQKTVFDDFEPLILFDDETKDNMELN